MTRTTVVSDAAMTITREGFAARPAGPVACSQTHAGLPWVTTTSCQPRVGSPDGSITQTEESS